MVGQAELFNFVSKKEISELKSAKYRLKLTLSCILLVRRGKEVYKILYINIIYLYIYIIYCVIHITYYKSYLLASYLLDVVLFIWLGE